MLCLFFAGNLEDNGNHINVFIADGQAGQNTLNVVGGWTESAMNGSVFSPGFNANLMLDFNDYYGVLYTDQIFLSPDGSTNFYLGSVTLTNGVGSITLNDLMIGFNDSNAAGVNGNTGTAANTVAAQAVSTGLEIGIPLSALGNPAPGSSILVLADINGTSDSYLSDQFLPGLPVGTGDLGAGGTYTGPLPGSFNLSGLSSNWFSVSVPAQATPTITWTNPASIAYGTACSSSQLNASANVPGSFAYNSTTGTVLNAGTNTLSVIFTPADTFDYSSVADSVSLVVLPAPLTVTAANAIRQAGAANPVFSGTITGVTDGDNITATYSCSATPSSPVGTYSIVPSLVDPNNRLPNYTVTIGNGTLTVISSLVVTGLQPGLSGVSVFFNRTINAGVLFLYGTNGPADFTLVGGNSGPVTGSLIVGAQATNVSFIKTGGPLPADIYTVTLVSATNGFEDLNGNLLDGTGDGVPGDIRVHEHAGAAAYVGEVHCSKKSASIEARNCAGVSVSGSVSSNRARPMRSDARDLLRCT